MKTLSVVLLLTFTIMPNAFAKKTREQRRAEREARKKTYGVSKGTKKWKCRKGQGSQTKSDCKATLRNICPTNDGWKMSGSSCKKQKLYKIKKGKSKWRCKKHSDGTHKTKSDCVSKLKQECATKASDGWVVKGSKCKKGKQYVFKYNSKKTKIKCSKARSSSSGTKYKDKDECKKALAQECTKKASEGFTMKGSSCRRGKQYTIRSNSKGTKMKCAKARSSDTGTTYKSKQDCIAKLKEQCTSKAAEGFTVKGSKCVKGKQYTIRANSSGTKMKCAKARSSDTGTTYNSKQDCVAKLKEQCTSKAAEGFTVKGSRCVKGKTKKYEIASVSKGFKCKRVRTEDAGKTYYNSKQDCAAALTTQCALKENVDKGYTMKGSRCTEGSGFMGKVGGFVSEHAGSAVSAVQEHGATAVGFFKNQANQKKLDACKKKLDEITSVSVELLKASESDPDEKSVFKTMNLTRAQLQTNLNHATLNSYKEEESEVSISQLAKTPIAGCDAGCVAKVKNFMTGAPNNSCDHIQTAESE